MNISSCIDEVLVRGLDDWIQAAEVASIARTHGGATKNDDIRDICIVVIRELLLRNLVQIGDVTTDGFKPWNVSDIEALARVDTGWRGRPGGPDLGEMFWLDLTEYGQGVARGLSVAN